MYFLKQKSEIFKVFKKLKVAMEKISGCQIKAMRSDRSENFTSKEFIKFSESNGIGRPLIVPRSLNKIVLQKGRYQI